MLTTRLRALCVAAAVVLAFSSSSAVASPITYTFVQTASGTLDGVAFTDATVTTTVNADTSNARPMFPFPGAPSWVMNNNASVTGTVEISGLGTFDLFNAIVFSTNTSLIGGDEFPTANIVYSGVGVGDLDDPPLFPPEGGFTHMEGGILDSGTDPTLYGYNLTTAMGPVAAIALAPASNPNNEFVDYDTSGGELVITSNTGTTTFTAVGGDGESTLIPGGPMGDPVTLGGNVGQVQGMIGGVGTQAFYRFYWPGGLFGATANVGATDPLSSYAFDLFQRATLLEEVVLKEANGFSGSILMQLLAGTYTIGINATNQPDPPFSIAFATPVNGVPEPGTLMLFLTGLTGLPGWRRFRRGLHDRHVGAASGTRSRAS